MNKMSKKKKRSITIVSIAGIILIAIILFVQFNPFAVIINGDGNGVVPPEPIYPSNPSLIINNDDILTNSFEITLTLYCDDADEMQFQLSYDTLSDWINYSTTYPITMVEGYLTIDNMFIISVVFRNGNGTTVDAGYDYIGDYIIYVDITEILPTNPSILINDGATTTNSFVNLLTLYCDNADEMKFQINDGVWSDWVAYSTTYTIILVESDPSYPDYDIEVIFRNNNGTSEDAGYSNIYDVIIYDPEGEPPPEPPETGDEVDYTILYVLVAVLVGGIGIIAFIQYRKKKDKRIRYTTKKGKSRVIKPLKLKSK